jgi:hypothetical protein
MAGDLPEDIVDRRAAVGNALADVETALAAPTGIGDEWRKRVEQTVLHLQHVGQEQLAAFVGADGLLDRIVAADEAQAPRAEKLRGRIPDLERHMNEVLGALDHGTPDEIREASIELLVDVVRVRHQTGDLLYDAFWRDIGSAD